MNEHKWRLASEEDVMPVGNRLLKMLGRKKNVRLISRSAYLHSTLQQMKQKTQEFVKFSCLSNGPSLAPNTHSSIDTKVEKSVLQKKPRLMFRM